MTLKKMTLIKKPTNSGQLKVKNHLFDIDKKNGTEKDFLDVVIVKQHNPNEKHYKIWSNLAQKVISLALKKKSLNELLANIVSKTPQVLGIDLWEVEKEPLML